MRMPGGVERGDAESAASTPRSSAEDEGPISMRGMRLSLQASQANLLAKAGQADEGDDEDWDD